MFAETTYDVRRVLLEQDGGQLGLVDRDEGEVAGNPVSIGVA